MPHGCIKNVKVDRWESERVRECPLSHLPVIDKWYIQRYIGSMKIKTSITLSKDILEAIDLHIGAYKSRSEFLETAARIFIDQLKKKEAEQRDLEILNKNSEALNHEAEDVLGYQVPI